MGTCCFQIQREQNSTDRASLLQSEVLEQGNHLRHGDCGSDDAVIPVILPESSTDTIKIEYQEPEQVLSEECKEDTPTLKDLLSFTETRRFIDHGYCSFGFDSAKQMVPTKSNLDCLINGWIRPELDCVVSIGVCVEIAKYTLENTKNMVQMESGSDIPLFFLIPRVSLSLSTKYCNLDAVSLKLDQVPGETLHHVVKYLGHHKGKEPDPLPCPVRSIHMSQICSDQWDATWIDSFDKKTIFEIILAANHIDIKSLVHLGSAKVATLIKQLDQKEINRILEEEEQHRRENAQSHQNDSDDHENDGAVDDTEDDDSS